MTDCETFNALLDTDGQRLLAEIAARGLTEANTLALATELRRRYPAPLVAAAMTQVRLRARAYTKFGDDAARMYFTQAGLEQATSGIVATHHAARYRAARRIADLCCGIGGDLRALVDGHDVLAVDRDPLTAAVAAANLRALGLASRVIVRCDDVTTVDFMGYDAAFLDPARRAAGRRIFNVADYQPPWSFIASLVGRVGNVGIKVAPGIPHDLVPPDTEAEWVSRDGDVKEAALWFGALRTAGVARRATLLPSGATLTATTREPPPLSSPRRYLFEPDGAVIRAHLVAEVAAQINGALLDPTIAYITSDTLTPTPFARAYIIEDAMPFSLKRLRAYLRERAIGHVVIKKRGSPLTPETLLNDLRLAGDNHCILFLTKVSGKHTVLIGSAVETA
ncbi:MAG: class I SAM-dependent methyltransferase [Thermomicrobia bacterium]|nr:class I SAM-dependent methyltransferase [Thermomicrobia bacterium]